MGILDGISDIIEPLVGAGVGYAAYTANPVLGAAVGSGIGLNLAGARQQEKALRRAGKIEEADRKRDEIRYQEFLLRNEGLLDETADIRRIGREQSSLLAEEAAAAPGSGPSARRALEKGIANIRNVYGKLGQGVGSSALAQAIGEFTGNVTSADVNRRTDISKFLAGGATTGLNLAAGARQPFYSPSNRLADIITAQGAQTGGTYGDLGSTLMMLPLLAGREQTTTPTTPTVPAGTTAPTTPGQFYLSDPYGRRAT
jgi:hypothetical protein